MSLSRTVASLFLLFSLTSTTYGDIAPGRGPLPKPPMVAPVRIVEGKIDDLDPNVVAKIVIPSSLLPDLQEPSYETQTSSESPPAETMIIVGLALTVAAISVLFVGKTSPHRKKGLLALSGCIVLVGIALLANSLIPPEFVPPTTDQSGPQRLIVIEVQEGGHEVTLVLSSRQ